MSRRHCESCTACCEGWLSSKHIEMSFGKPCRHCTVNGCAIYPTRPEKPCRTFECEWILRNGGGATRMPETMRPDRCGAIVLSDREFHGWKVLIATPTGWKIPQKTLQRLMQYARERETPLIWIENIQRDGIYTHFSRSGYGPRPFMETIARHSKGVESLEI